MIFGNATTLGLDLGATGVRAAEVAWHGGRPILVRWAAADFPAEVTDWRGIDRPAVVALLREMLSQSRMDKIKWAAHSISGESVALQYFNFPKLMSEDVAEAVRIEAETALPFRAEGALISYVLYPDQRSATGKARSHGLAIAADGQFAKTRMDILREARLEPFCVETDATATCNAFLATHGLKNAGAGTTALVNIGHQRSNLAVLNSKGTLLIRDVPWGGIHFTKALSELCSAPVEEAESGKARGLGRGRCRRKASAREARVQEAIRFRRQGVRRPPARHHRILGERAARRAASNTSSSPAAVPRSAACRNFSPTRSPCPSSDGRRCWMPRAGPRLPTPATAIRNPNSSQWSYRMSVAFGLALRRFGEK